MIDFFLTFILQPKKPFQRVNVEEVVFTDDRLKDNSYWAKVLYDLHFSLHIAVFVFSNAFIEVYFFVSYRVVLILVMVLKLKRF